MNPNSLIQQIISHWPAEMRHTISESSISTFNFSPSTQNFLLSAGLPKKQLLLVHFTDYFEKISERLIIIADDGLNTHYCIDTSDHDQIKSFSFGRNNGTFVNSGIAEFVGCLLLFDRNASRRQSIDQNNNNEIDENTEFFKMDLYEIDPALKEDNYLWSTVVEEMENRII